jgi:hypothetical protein
MTIADIMNRAVGGLTSRFGADTKAPKLSSTYDFQTTTETVHLILDLDQTLISSFEFGYHANSGSRILPNSLSGRAEPGFIVSNSVAPILTEEYTDEYGLPEMYHATISGTAVLIKLRPHVRRLIRTAAAQYKLHVYTKGRRAYMQEVLHLLDPTGDYITGRRVSRDDEPVGFRDHQKDISLVFGDDIAPSKYVVLDDSPQVWTTSPNIIPQAVVAAVRYSFSDNFANSILRTLGDRQKDERYPRDTDSFLRTILGALDEVIAEVFSKTDGGSPTSCSTEESGEFEG